MERSRWCVQCNAPLSACMGFVKAGDVLAGKDPPRELCGKCALVWEWSPEGTLIRQIVTA